MKMENLTNKMDGIGMKKNSLKATALNIKEVVESNKEIDVESYAKELSNNSSLDFYDVISIYNDMFNMRTSREGSKVKKRVWTKSEDDLILNYFNMSKRENSKRSVTDIIDDVSELFSDRSASSISFRYYNVLTKRDGNAHTEEVAEDTSNELVESKDVQTAEDNTKIEGKEDLLDIIVELVENVEMADLDVTSLFKSLLHLSAKAVDKKNLDEIERLKEMLKSEREVNASLRLEIKEMTKDLSILKREFENFNRMDGKEKIKNIGSLSNSVKYVVDKFGNIYLK